MLKQFNLEPSNTQAAQIGDVFGRLTVLAVGRKKNSYHQMAVCQCSCGSEPKVIKIDHFKSGAVVSCGCFHKEQHLIHGLSQHVHYGRWHNMLDRCENPKSGSWDRYGGRGISVCERWHRVENFIADLPDGYFEGAEMDRIENDGNYEPGNIRWATHGKNCDNRSTGAEFTFNGKTQSLARWSEETGLAYSLLSERINKFNWTIEQALTTPVIDANERMERARLAWWGPLKSFELDGKSYTIAELSKHTGLTESLLRQRLCEKGWAIEDAIKPVKVDATFEVEGVLRTIAELSEMLGVTKVLLRKQLLERKWPIVKVLAKAQFKV